MYRVLLFIQIFINAINSYAQTADTTKVDSLLLNVKAPAFSGRGISGKNWDNEKLKGKVVLINFWFIGCPHCMTEIEHLNKIQDHYKGKDFIVLSFAPQSKQDIDSFNDIVNNTRLSRLRKIMGAKPIQYEVIPTCSTRNYILKDTLRPECDNIVKDFKITGYPTTFIIDKNGIIRFSKIGFSAVLPEEYIKVIDQLILE